MERGHVPGVVGFGFTSVRMLMKLLVSEITFLFSIAIHAMYCRMLRSHLKGEFMSKKSGTLLAVKHIHR